MTKLFAILLFAAFAMNASADCRGCCSHHGGVRCIKGETKCADGIPLSWKCQSKGCNKCGSTTTGGGKVSKKVRDAPRNPKPAKKFDRKDWPHWIDEDGDCQDTRAEMLIKYNTGELKFKRNKECNVSWGRWVCPYTGKELTKASDVDIDHVVPLANAHRSGGATWTREQKREFANDPLNLLVVDDAANQAKGDKGPDEWKPESKRYWKEYAWRWKTVKEKYNLTISRPETWALIEMRKVGERLPEPEPETADETGPIEIEIPSPAVEELTL